ncbi:MAG: universal stress protein [Chloroflexi bacterium]|nr:universal stress protein [Chloroflexota bacterium]
MFKKVLVPLDRSELASEILPYVSWLAGRLQAKVVLMSSISPSRGSETSEADVKSELDRVGDALANLGVRSESVVTKGDPAEEILRVAQLEGCDIIAMSTHGRSSLGRGVMGSVTDQVVRRSPIPTLALSSQHHEDVKHSRPLAKIVLSLDGTPRAEKAVPYVEELAKSLALDVLLVRVIDTGGPYVGLLEDTRFIKVDPEIKAEATAYIREVARKMTAQGLNVEWKILEGTPTESILRLVRETPDDLMVLASRGHAGLTRLLEGSVAETVVRGSGRPVLVLPQDAAV